MNKGLEILFVESGAAQKRRRSWRSALRMIKQLCLQRMPRRVARRVLRNRPQTVFGAGRRAGRHGVALHVSADIRIGRHVRVGFPVFSRPHLLGAIDLAQVLQTGISLGCAPGSREVGNRDRRKQPDNGYHDHDFHEREA